MLDDAFHLVGIVSRCSKRLDRQPWRNGLDRLRVQERRCIRIVEVCDSRDVWSDSFHQFKPLTGDRCIEIRETSEVATWPLQALDYTNGDWVTDLDEHGGRRAGDVLDRDGDGRRIGEDH